MTHFLIVYIKGTIFFFNNKNLIIFIFLLESSCSELLCSVMTSFILKITTSERNFVIYAINNEHNQHNLMIHLGIFIGFTDLYLFGFTIYRL